MHDWHQRTAQLLRLHDGQAQGAYLFQADPRRQAAEGRAMGEAELPVQQGAAVELDQALGPVVGQVTETRALAGRKDNGFLHMAARLPANCGIGLAKILHSPHCSIDPWRFSRVPCI